MRKIHTYKAIGQAHYIPTQGNCVAERFS